MQYFYTLYPEIFFTILLCFISFCRQKEILFAIAAIFTSFLIGAKFFDINFEDHSIRISQITQSLKIFILILFSCVSLLSYKIRLEMKEGFSILFGFIIISGMFLFSANDLIMIYISLEMQSLASYALVAMNKNNRSSIEAGIKYFITGALASCIMLYGLSLIYSFLGTLEINQITENLIANEKSLVLNVGISMFLFGILFKLGCAPLHQWILDVYEGSNIIVVVFLAIFTKIPLIFILEKLINLGFFSTIISKIFITVGLLSMLIGSIGGLYQKNIKRLFGYSTISHSGFLVISLACLKHNTSNLDIFSPFMLYICLYSIISIGIFAYLIERKDFSLDSFLHEGKKGIHKYLPAIFTTLIIAIAGLPPFPLFYTKIYLLLYVINNGLFYISFLILIFSVISCFYYLKIIKRMYFYSKEETYAGSEIHISTTPKFIVYLSISVIILLSTIFLLFFI